jgi:hypothetical protein
MAPPIEPMQKNLRHWQLEAIPFLSRSRTYKVRGRTTNQVNRLMVIFEPWQQTFPPQIIQGLL